MYFPGNLKIKQKNPIHVGLLKNPRKHPRPPWKPQNPRLGRKAHI